MKMKLVITFCYIVIFPNLVQRLKEKFENSTFLEFFVYNLYLFGYIILERRFSFVIGIFVLVITKILSRLQKTVNYFVKN